MIISFWEGEGWREGSLCGLIFSLLIISCQTARFNEFFEKSFVFLKYYFAALLGVSPLYVMAQHHQLRSNLSGGGGAPLYRRLSTTSGCGVWSSAKGDDDSGGSGVTSDAILVADNNEIMVAEPSSAADDGSSTKMVHHHGHPMNDAGGTMDGDVLRRVGFSFFVE